MPGVSLAQPDITIALDDDGIIRDATLSNAISGEGFEAWRGRPWQETVSDGGGQRIRLIVEDARTSGISAFRHVLQRFPSGLELPIEYTTVRVDGRHGGREGGLLAIGKNMQAVNELQTRLIATQQAREQEYWKLREVETRYRLLFDASHEAVLLVRVENFQVVEANPAAIRSLGVAPGWEFLPDLPHGEREAFRAMLARVREQGRAPGILVHLGLARESWTLRASLVAAESGLLYLLHLSQLGVQSGARGAGLGEPGRLGAPRAMGAPAVEDLIDRMPDAFVVIDLEGMVLRANQAFAELVQVGYAAAVLGERIGRWLSHPGSDFSVLLGAVQRHRTVRLLSTTIHGELGGETEVEISAAGNAETRASCYGLLLRDVGRRLAVAGGELAEVLRAATNQVGRMPMLKVVRDTADAVERHYIRTALDIADGNRTAAAELLGLSRQSLHTKLNRHGFETAGGAADLPAHDLPAPDLPARHLPARHLPARDPAARDLAAIDLSE
jgi:transcriptional regulator PpsR